MNKQIEIFHLKDILKKLALLFAICLVVIQLAGCREEPGIVQSLPQDSSVTSDIQENRESNESEPEQDGHPGISWSGTLTPDVIFHHEPKPGEVKNTEGLPYMNPEYQCVPVMTTGLSSPWELYPFLQDSVKRLSIEDLTGEAIFFCNSIYSIITEDGNLRDSPSAPIGEDPPETAELYLAKTSITSQLQEGDVIALAAIEHYPLGVTTKIITVHPAEELYCHFTIQAPQIDEMIDREKMKQE